MPEIWWFYQKRNCCLVQIIFRASSIRTTTSYSELVPELSRRRLKLNCNPRIECCRIYLRLKRGCGISQSLLKWIFTTKADLNKSLTPMTLLCPDNFTTIICAYLAICPCLQKLLQFCLLLRSLYNSKSVTSTFYFAKPCPYKRL